MPIQTMFVPKLADARLSVYKAGQMVAVDMSRPRDPREPLSTWTGPRCVFERIKKPFLGWKIIVHGHGSCDPSHCIVIPDNEQDVRIMTEGQEWPKSIGA